jgi:hypothetical protein
MEGMEEEAPESDYRAYQHFITDAKWDHQKILSKVAKATSIAMVRVPTNPLNKPSNPEGTCQNTKCINKNPSLICFKNQNCESPYHRIEQMNDDILLGQRPNSTFLAIGFIWM